METRKKIGDAHRGKIVSLETRAKMSKANQNTNLTLLNPPVQVTVFKEDGTQHPQSPFRSLTQASKILKIDPKTIKKYMNKNTIFKGLIFKTKVDL